MSEPYLTRWQLRRDGAPISTPRARLWPVLTPAGAPAMLKVSSADDERDAHRLLRWWDGDGAARLLAHDGPAILLERAEGESLRRRSIEGADAACTTILCGVLERLHRPRGVAPPGLVPLREWFADLLRPRTGLSPMLEQCRSLAEELLAAEQEPMPLRGDLHHDNVLDFGARGWLAIDPKRLQGDRAFDYTALFANPDLCGPGIHVAVRPGRFHARLAQVSAEAGLERTRLLRWIAASRGLSATWFLDDRDRADVDLAVVALALQALAG